MKPMIPSHECCIAERLSEIVTRYGITGEDRDALLNAASILRRQNNCPPHLPDFYRGSAVRTGKVNNRSDAPQGRVE